MKKALASLLLLAFSLMWVNMFAQSMQLVPLGETNIVLQKETMTINRIDNHIQVTTDYEFFNPSEAKTLMVCYEADPPDMRDDYDFDQLYRDNPQLRNFKVIVNGKVLPYEVAHVTYQFDEDYQRTKGKYYSNGRFHDMTRKECEEALKDEELTVGGMYLPFYYVYHFNVHFNKGKNVIRHTCEFDLFHWISSVEKEYSFACYLTDARRWANKGIDDFTLEMDLGDRESFMIQPYFFKDVKEWTINGKGKMTMEENWGFAEQSGSPVFHMQEGRITYKKKNFHPEGALVVMKRRFFLSEYNSNLGEYECLRADFLLDIFKERYFRLSLGMLGYTGNTTFTAEQKRVLRNLPFAYRGHVFKDAGLKQYFESTNWYIPNPGYVDKMEELSKNEREWVQFWSK
jgi:hypothetical protein